MLRHLRPGRRAAGAPRIYLLLSGAQSLFYALIFTVSMIYQVTVVGLSPLQLVLVGTLLEAVYFTFEVPTGIVADAYSRRLSIVIGLVLTGAGFTVVGAIPHLAAVLAGQVLWGIGATFLSGAIEAWITDEVGEEEVGDLFLRGGQVALVCAIVGTVLATLAGLISLRIPIITGGVAFMALSLVLLAVMPETWQPSGRESATSHLAHMRDTFARGVRLARERATVRTLVLISLFVGLASEAFDRLHTKYLLDRFAFPTAFGTDDPVLWFGGASLVGMALGLIAAEVWKRRRPETLASGVPARLLAVFAALQVLATLLFIFAGSLWLAFAALWARGVIETLAEPIRAAWMNRNIESHARATVLSIEGQANAIGQVGGGPALGWVGSSVSIRAALLGSILLLSPIVALYGRFVTRKGEPVVEPVPQPEPGG